MKETLIIACTLRTNSGCEVKHESVKRFLSVFVNTSEKKRSHFILFSSYFQPSQKLRHKRHI